MSILLERVYDNEDWLPETDDWEEDFDDDMEEFYHQQQQENRF